MEELHKKTQVVIEYSIRKLKKKHRQCRGQHQKANGKNKSAVGVI